MVRPLALKVLVCHKLPHNFNVSFKLPNRTPSSPAIACPNKSCTIMQLCIEMAMIFDIFQAH